MSSYDEEEHLDGVNRGVWDVNGFIFWIVSHLSCGVTVSPINMDKANGYIAPDQP